MTDDGRDPTSAKFLRGLTIGALIGAVIAGSSIWSRRLATRRPAPAESPEPATGPAVAAETTTPTTDQPPA